jgi:pimeloyl-ACP methyl ester carboxylesterase
VNHHREGSGPPYVLLHGIGHHWQGWAPVIRHLRDGFEVVAVDSPGFGASPPLPDGHDPSVHGYADAVAAWLAAEGIDRPHVAGNSMGGGIALELARRGLVASVVAISPVGFWSPAERRWCQVALSAGFTPRALQPALLAAAGSAAGRRALFGHLFARPGRMPAEAARALLRDAWAAPAFGPALRAFDRYDFERGDELRGTPVTVAWGTRDLLLPFGPQHRRAQQRLPWARHVRLRGLGHTPMWDDPGVVAHVLRAGAGGA